MKWLKGRQKNCEYKKLKLFSFKIWKYGFDAYVLKFNPFSLLDFHVDPVEGGKHWRKNYRLKGWYTVSIKVDGVTRRYLRNDAPWFRPDTYEHALSTYHHKCYILSLGFVKFD